MSFPRYEKYKDSGVEWLGEVPTNWDVLALKRVASLKSGEAITAEDIREEGRFPVYGGNGLRGYTDNFTHEGQYALIGRQGALCGNVNYAQHKFWASEHAVVVSPLKPVATFWLGELLREMNLGQYSIAAAQPGLSVDIISNLRIPLPPIEEQEAIAEFLDRETSKIDALVSEQRRLIELLQEKRQTTISHAVTNGLNPNAPMKDSGVEWLGQVPSHWEVKQLRHTARIVRGASPRPAGDPKYFSSDDLDSNIPWVTVAEITKDTIPYLDETSEFLTPLGAENSQMFERGIVVFTNSGATLGVPKILNIECCANDGVLAFKSLSDLVCKMFLYYFLLTTTERLRTEMKQGGGQPNLNTNIVKEIGFALPPIKEQEAIVAFLDEETRKYDELMAEAERAIELLQERRTALISAAVTGKIDVRPSAGSGLRQP